MSGETLGKAIYLAVTGSDHDLQGERAGPSIQKKRAHPLPTVNTNVRKLRIFGLSQIKSNVATLFLPTEYVQ